MDIILIHGMGRTPLSMLVLSHRLRLRGFSTRLFGYSPTFETIEGCKLRLVSFIQKATGSRPYALVGHSLGAVLIRTALPWLKYNPPTACFFLAPPSQVCQTANFFADNLIYRLLMGEMGQLLANGNFMASLPLPSMPTRIYAGIGGPVGKFSPFENKPNDGILTVEETQGSLDIPVTLVPSIHTFIMNSSMVADDIINNLGDIQ